MFVFFGHRIPQPRRVYPRNQLYPETEIPSQSSVAWDKRGARVSKTIEDGREGRRRRGGEERRSVAFYALNVHSEVDRRWKRQSGRFPPSFLRFCRGDRSSCDRRTGSGGCSPLPSSAEWLASLVKRDKNLGRYISAGCVDTNVRILICEGSPLLLPPPLPPRFVALGPPPYIYCETFFGHVSHRPIPSSLKVLFPRRYWEEKESGCPVSKENR